MSSRFLCKRCRPWRHAAHALERFAEAWAAVPWPIKIKTEMCTAIILGRQVYLPNVRNLSLRNLESIWRRLWTYYSWSFLVHLHFHLAIHTSRAQMKRQVQIQITCFEKSGSADYWAPALQLAPDGWGIEADDEDLWRLRKVPCLLTSDPPFSWFLNICETKLVSWRQYFHIAFLHGGLFFFEKESDRINMEKSWQSLGSDKGP